jgi:transaldolase
MFNYFVDTADIDYISKLDLANRFDPVHMLGITTNPNAMSKINHWSLDSWTQVLPKLCELVSSIRGDNLGQVHVQAPNSHMTGDEVLKFAEYIYKFNDANTKLALKIPPTISVLKRVDDIKVFMPVNVTGLSDCCSAFACLEHGVDYVSIIPGRMEEVGIDANAHLRFITKRTGKGYHKVITGSMRTVEGLLNAVRYHTIPTIGTRVWDKLVDFDLNNHQIDYYDEDTVEMFAPDINDDNRNLSTSFFYQMDGLGIQAYKDFLNNF